MPEVTIHDRFLAFKVHKGFKDRGLPYTQEYQDRIAFELGVIRAIFEFSSGLESGFGYRYPG